MMVRVRFGDVVKEVKINIDRATDTHEFYIAGEHMESNNIHLTKRGCFEGSDVGPAFIRLFRPGQVLYGSRRTYLKKVAVADFEGITSNTTFVLETKDESVLLQSLIPFIMLTDSFTEHAVKNSKGSTNPYILFSDLCSYEFELPSIETQRALSAQLWAFDRTAEAYKRLLRATDELVKSQFIEMFGDPLVNGKKWDVCEFSKLCSSIGDGLHGTPIYDDNGPYPFINGNNLREDKIEISPETRRVAQEMYDKHFIRLDDTTVLLSINGTLGKTALYNGEAVILGKSACYSNVGAKLKREFVLAVFKTDAFQQYMENNCTGTTIKNFGLKALRSYPMIVPPLENQNYFIEIMHQTDKSKLAIRQSLESLEKSRNALMNQIFG